MKLKAEDQLEPKTSISVEVEKQLKLKFQGRLTPKRGHTCFEFETTTGKLRFAVFTKEAANIDWNPTSDKVEAPKKKKIITNKDCIYFTALNWKNAEKVLRRDFGITGDILKSQKREENAKK
jgi:hypothetical protein